MARPPKNAEGPSATERMELAFWDCMKEMPFSEITVRDIVSRANVNRNSYYYHYDSMWDLAQASVEHADFAAVARVLLEGFVADEATDADGIAAQAQKGFDHLRVLASENGNQRLLEDAKHSVVNEWLALFELREDQASERDALLYRLRVWWGRGPASRWPTRGFGYIRDNDRGFSPPHEHHRDAAQ